MAAPRLNPFAFVSDTTLRFGLLIVVVVSADITRWFGIAAISGDLAIHWASCFVGIRPIGPDLADPGNFSRFLECARSYPGEILPFILSGLGLLIGTTLLLRLVQPRWQVRRLRLRPLDSGAIPGLDDELRALCRIAGLLAPPRFWWNPLDGRPLALVFGGIRGCHIGLTAGTVLQYVSNPAGFRAVLLHELAHIRNGDVGLTYTALAVWQAFLATALLPYLVAAMTVHQTVADVGIMFAQLGMIGGYVYATRNGVLRARELYADARSLGWHQNQAALGRLLADLRRGSFWRGPFSPHPDPARRLRLLLATDEMFRFSDGDAFATGVAMGFAAVTLWMLGALYGISRGMQGAIAVYAGPVLPMVIVVPIALAIAAISTWRVTFQSWMRGRDGGTVRPAFWLASGAVTGGLLLPGMAAMGASLNIDIAPGWVQPAGAFWPLIFLALAAAALVVLALTVGLALFLRWAAATATAWLAAALRVSAPGRIYAGGLMFCCLVAAPWFAFVPLAIGSVTLQAFEHHLSLASIVSMSVMATQLFPFNLLTWSSLVLVWALPLAAALWPERGAECDRGVWAFLDPPPADWRPPASPVRLGRALAIGVIGGILGAMAVWLLSLPLWTDQSTGSWPTELLTRSALIGVVAQAVTGAAAALAIPRLPVTHALSAAFVAGLVLASASTLLIMPVIGHSGWWILTALCPPIMVGGAWAASMTALFALLLRTVVRSARRPTET